MIVGCISDYVWSFSGDGIDHKEAAGIVIVIIDILSVLVMCYMIKKLQTLNT
jgi:hypothetical protein